MLRRWKNNNRHAFFHTAIISPEQQREWFDGYLTREHDHMFIVLAAKSAVGCMGFRILDAHADIYNVILGESEAGGRGVMGNALRLMCSYILARFTTSIGVKVLRSNPAINWYQKLGFRESAAHDTYLDLLLSSSFEPCAFDVEQQTNLSNAWTGREN